MEATSTCTAESTSRRRYQRKRRYCAHCDDYVAYSTFREHKRFLQNDGRLSQSHTGDDNTGYSSCDRVEQAADSFSDDEQPPEDGDGTSEESHCESDDSGQALKDLGLQVWT